MANLISNIVPSFTDRCYLCNSMTLDADYWIRNLHLTAHPEGGYYRETYRSSELLSTCGLPARFDAPRNASTAIYFLLRNADRSAFHRIKSDELWHYHAGDCLTIYVLHPGGAQVHKLGPRLELGEQLQVVIPANHWFGARVAEGGKYTLCSCTVAPGFDFDDFEIGDQDTLTNEFHHSAEIIRALT